MFLDFAGMLADPAKGWKSALDKATGMLGGTIKELVFADTMAGEIAAAQQKVDSLKQSVLGLEDAIKLSAIQSAASKLEAEQTKLAAMLDGLVGTVYQAETAQQDLHQALTSLGGKGRRPPPHSTRAAPCWTWGTTPPSQTPRRARPARRHGRRRPVAGPDRRSSTWARSSR